MNIAPYVRNSEFSAYTEAMLRMMTNLSMMGNTVNEIDETTMDLWAMHTNNTSLITINGREQTWSKARDGVFHWYVAKIQQMCRSYSGKVTGELFGHVEMTTRLLRRGKLAKSTEEFLDQMVHLEHRVTDQFDRGQAYQGYNDSNDELLSNIAYILNGGYTQPQSKEPDVTHCVRITKTLAMCTRMFLESTGAWELGHYERIRPTVEANADGLYRGSDLISNIMLSIRFPRTLEKLSPEERFRDNLSRDAVIEMLVLSKLQEESSEKQFAHSR